MLDHNDGWHRGTISSHPDNDDDRHFRFARKYPYPINLDRSWREMFEDNADMIVVIVLVVGLIVGLIAGRL